MCGIWLCCCAVRQLISGGGRTGRCRKLYSSNLYWRKPLKSGRAQNSPGTHEAPTARMNEFKSHCGNHLYFQSHRSWLPCTPQISTNQFVVEAGKNIPRFTQMIDYSGYNTTCWVFSVPCLFVYLLQWHNGLAACVTKSQQKGWGLDCRLLPVSAWFLWVLQLPPTVRKHACEVDWKLEMLWVCSWVQRVFFPCDELVQGIAPPSPKIGSSRQLWLELSN